MTVWHYPLILFPKKERKKHPLNLKSPQSIPKDFGYYISWLSFPLDLHIFKGDVLYINRWVSQGLCGKEFTCQYRRYRRQGFNPWVRKIPWERKWQPIPILLPRKPHGQRSLATTDHPVTESWTQLSTRT